ncbi:DNA mismatch repair protein MLH1-like isoform X2 [Salvia divinorum]|uniref:DNA mismatch repair protein MLH1-like isoform X2 n=1 Tax=Salvia divinorum TaxID=28513 RepID=A0ABD1GZ01_SALDI
MNPRLAFHASGSLRSLVLVPRNSNEPRTFREQKVDPLANSISRSKAASTPPSAFGTKPQKVAVHNDVC